jgi:hypothetical protein
MARSQGARPVRPAKKFRIEELIGALPAAIAEYLLDALDWAGWLNERVPIAEIRARVTASAYVT